MPVAGLSTFASVLFAVIPGAVFVGMVAALLLGRRIGARRLASTGDAAANEGTGSVEATLFALLGLLVAFSFSGAQTRLDARRTMIVDEANAIGTAYLRLDLLPKANQPALRDIFRRYVDARIAYYKALLDPDTGRSQYALAADLQQQIWTAAVAATERAADPRAAILVVPALNQMFDITSARNAARRMHIPTPIFGLLGLLALLCAFLAGVAMARSRRPSVLHVFTFAGTMALTAYVILNLEFPRLGFVNFEGLDALLAEVRAGMR